MLEFIRNRAQGFFAWLIVGGIIVTFALFGINHYFTGGGDNSVAKVNDREISQGELQRAYIDQRQRLTQMFGGELPEVFTEKMLKQQALSQLVSQEVLIQAARENNMYIGDGQLAGMIRSVEAFQEDGKFSRANYEELLAARGMTPAAFESRVRRDMLAAQFQAGYSESVFITKAEEDDLLRLKNQQRTVGYLQVALAPFQEAASVTDEEIQQYYETNQQRFMQPERVKVDYLELNAEALASDIEVDEETLRTRYEAQKINYTTPEERKASHILIKANEDASQQEIDQARDKAQAILERIRGGEDFAELAKAESDDPGSAKQGGDLGFFGRGAMVPAFEEAAFALQKGEVSEIVRSPFGFHIIKLEDVRGGEVKPFEAVKEDIRKEVQTERAEERFYEMAEKLDNLTYEHPESLQVASDELGLPVKSSGYFTRQGGSGIAANQKVTSAAFSEEVLENGYNSKALELDRNHLVVLRLNEHKPEQLRPLEEVRQGIVTVLEREKAQEEAEKLAASLLEKVRSGEDPAGLAGNEAVTWHAGKSVTREDSEMTQAVLNRAFSLPKPEGESISSDTVALASGDQSVVVLYDVTEGEPASADESERQQVREQLLRAESSAISQAVMSGIRARMDITIKD